MCAEVGSDDARGAAGACPDGRGSLDRDGGGGRGIGGVGIRPTGADGQPRRDWSRVGPLIERGHFARVGVRRTGDRGPAEVRQARPGGNGCPAQERIDLARVLRGLASAEGGDQEARASIQISSVPHIIAGSPSRILTRPPRIAYIG